MACEDALKPPYTNPKAPCFPAGDAAKDASQSTSAFPVNTGGKWDIGEPERAAQRHILSDHCLSLQSRHHSSRN